MLRRGGRRSRSRGKKDTFWCWCLVQGRSAGASVVASSIPSKIENCGGLFLGQGTFDRTENSSWEGPLTGPEFFGGVERFFFRGGTNCFCQSSATYTRNADGSPRQSPGKPTRNSGTIFVDAVNVIVRKFVSKNRVVFRVWSKGLLPRVQGSIESLANPARGAASSCKF